MKVTQGNGAGSILESLSLKVEGQASAQPQATVLSCGGIFFPRRKIPQEFRTWQQIVNLPGNEISAKIFGVEPPDPHQALQATIQKEGLN